jgi:hypothetical protein
MMTNLATANVAAALLASIEAWEAMMGDPEGLMGAKVG